MITNEAKAVNVCEVRNRRIGKLDFELGVPTEKTAAKLSDEMDF